MPTNTRLLVLMRALLTVAFLASLVLGQSNQKGPPTTCVAPTVPPPDSTCFVGAGCRDSSFGGGNGFAYYNQLGNLKAVMTLPDGKIVAVGQGSSGPGSTTGTDLLVMRFNGDGSRDDTFGDVDTGNPLLRVGYRYIAVSSGIDIINTGALQADGKILAGGYSQGVWLLVRMLADGTLDSSFDGDGVLTVSGQGGGIDGLAVQADGKIVVGGDANFNTARFNADGTFDTTYGTGGRAIHNASPLRNGGSRVFSIALQRVAAAPSEERIVIGGWATITSKGTTAFALMRLRWNGVADSTFGTGGKASTSYGGNGDQARAIRIDPSNRIVAAGIARVTNCGQTDFGVARYTENGQPDNTFGTQGKASVDLYNGDNSVYALAVLSSGKIVVGGNASVFDSSGFRTMYQTLVAFDAAGNRDATFGPGNAGPGIVTTLFTGATASTFAYTLHEQADGKILSGGVSIEKPALVRYLP